MASFEPLAEYLGIGRFGGVGVASDLVPELAAQHLVDGNVVGLSSQVPKRHLDGADAAALARLAAELLDLAKKFVDVAGVLAQQPALEQERVILAGAIPHLAQAVDALVGIDADQRTGHGRAWPRQAARVGESQIGKAW